MDFESRILNDTIVRISSITPHQGIAEHHVIVECTDYDKDFDQQLESVRRALEHTLSQWTDAEVVFCRYFLSDPMNQADKLPHLCATSIVGQAPLSGSKLALWAYVQQGVKTSAVSDDAWVVSHGQYQHLWTTTMPTVDTSYVDTVQGFEMLKRLLSRYDANIADNCQRTWLFVRDIDTNYAGAVKGRNHMFSLNGLTPDTHFIASTGIGAEMPDAHAILRMDTYSVIGIDQRQVRYLVAPENLNPTIEYGVAFERGTMLQYGDRRHVFISGTASIDNHGEILHCGKVAMQARRALENVAALLRKADCDFSDIASIIVYLRDMADYHTVSRLLTDMLGDIPYVIVKGPVCRPGWLIEFECMAIKNSGNKEYAPL